MPYEFTILDESPYMNTEDPAKPYEAMMVTFQLPDGRVETLSLPAAGYTKEKRNAAIVEKIKKMGPSKWEKVRVP
jgi:hypothetical protein